MLCAARNSASHGLPCSFIGNHSPTCTYLSATASAAASTPSQRRKHRAAAAAIKRLLRLIFTNTPSCTPLAFLPPYIHVHPYTHLAHPAPSGCGPDAAAAATRCLAAHGSTFERRRKCACSMRSKILQFSYSQPPLQFRARGASDEAVRAGRRRCGWGGG